MIFLWALLRHPAAHGYVRVVLPVLLYRADPRSSSAKYPSAAQSSSRSVWRGLARGAARCPLPRPRSISNQPTRADSNYGTAGTPNYLSLAIPLFIVVFYFPLPPPSPGGRLHDAPRRRRPSHTRLAGAPLPQTRSSLWRLAQGRRSGAPEEKREATRTRSLLLHAGDHNGSSGQSPVPWRCLSPSPWLVIPLSFSWPSQPSSGRGRRLVSAFVLVPCR